MESMESVQMPSILEIKNEQQNLQMQEEKSSENFQKIMFDLFEKNGVLNDLRAYLRKHIVDVLKSATVGDIPACQKHFTQRLDLSIQAINMLIAEYLLRHEYSYTLSVFISEIPLANMVFDFAGALMRGETEKTQLRFLEKDVWSILNYLGVKLDCNHVNNLIEMYKREENTPLLLCILKSVPMYQTEIPSAEEGSASEQSASSITSMDMVSDKPRRKFSYKCRHYSSCKSCHSKLTRMQERCRKRKSAFVKKQSSINSLNAQSILNNISAVEGSMVDELFEQLKTVYEAEVEMMRVEEQQKVKRSLATHALQLLQQKQEMEEAFKAREEELEYNVKQKKKFLWGLARSLKEQHEQMTRAMLAVKHQTHRLSSKENQLRTQLLEAEKNLKRRGEDMREQISSELVTLENNLESMRRERDNLHREREEFEQLKVNHSRSSSEHKIRTTDEAETPPVHYEKLKNELSILRTYIEALHLQHKQVSECATMTEDAETGPTRLSREVLNNENERVSKDVRKNSHLVNDLKKQKNVNFFVGNEEDSPPSRRESSSSVGEPAGAGSGAGGASTAGAAYRALLQLRKENERLRQLSTAQAQQIEQLSRAAATALRDLGAPPTPIAAPYMLNALNVNAGGGSVSSLGWRLGGGEELTFLAGAATRAGGTLRPGDHVPFIGVLRDSPADTRQLINQWRALHRHGRRPPAAAPAPAQPDSVDPAAATPPEQLERAPAFTEPGREPQTETSTITKRLSSPQRPTSAKADRNREKSPKSVLREAKQKLRTNSSPQYSENTSSREKSPSAVLREAKLRLRKLEIEAEAVEKSYLDFRKRQSGQRPALHPPEEALVTKDTTQELCINRSRSLQNTDLAEMSASTYGDLTQKLIHEDFDKYLREYHAKFGLSDSHFANRNAVTAQAKPIPDEYSTKESNNVLKLTAKLNYVETPLSEFRNFYFTDTKREIENSIDRKERHMKSPPQIDKTEVQDGTKDSNEQELEAKNDAYLNEKNCKQVELEILKNNINKIYNIGDKTAEITPTEISKESEANGAQITKEIESNMLRIEVESVKRISAINVVESDPTNILVMVESGIEASALMPADSDNEVSTNKEQISGNMTILISPKRSYSDTKDRSKTPNSRRSVSPEQAAKLTRNDVFEAIFHADPMKGNSSHEIQPIGSKDHASESVESNSEGKDDPPDNYTDDFSADVDNYNTLSENVSPTSFAKSPADETFWDS